jgi:endoglycosylceramidase
VIRTRHPSALLFLEGQITTNCGVATRLPRPAFAGAAYAPHYYKPVPMVCGHWFGVQHNIDRAFVQMTATAQAWDCPLFLGEFGMAADCTNAGDYIAAVYEHLDACLASGAQWNYTPTWTEQARDGWNAEDFHILCTCGAPRPNFRPRPYPRLTAGVPLRFAYHEAGAARRVPALEFAWAHDPNRGETEIFVPATLFPSGSAPTVEPPDVACRYDAARQVLACRVARPTTIVLQLQAQGAR